MMLNNDSYKLPLPFRGAALFFVGLVLVLLAIFMPADSEAGELGGGYVFPLPGPHTYGDGFGAGRGHDGQDLFANCGSKLVAVKNGRVQHRARNAGGWGNYLVLDVRETKVDMLYAHMRKADMPREGARVRTGEKIGEVGETGNASGCHLHFEMHSAPGFWEGGHAMRSVTKHLKRWDRNS